MCPDTSVTHVPGSDRVPRLEKQALAPPRRRPAECRARRAAIVQVHFSLAIAAAARTSTDWARTLPCAFFGRVSVKMTSGNSDLR